MIRHILPAILIAGAAQAQMPCGPRDEIVAQLKLRYGETQRAVGMQGPRSMVEVYASETGTWTILRTDDSGMACLVGAGDNWRASPAKPKGAPS